ncbi:MAG: sodium:solute symporter family protein [Acidobacteria bacterium]|nr:sodium:solute symporter family protein [Acidobacteriota bacterium]
MKKTKDLTTFSVGARDMSPYLVGLTMAASIASTATFVINPGFVYVHGLSAYLHYGVAAFLGIAVALISLTAGFRRQGAQYGALTIPHWIFAHYGSRALATFYAVVNLLSLTFVVLILVGCALLAHTLFDVSYHACLTVILLFVFSYVLMGGTYAHAYTNAFQAVMMLVISCVLFFSGWEHLVGGFGDRLVAVSQDYAAVFNPSSNLYYDFMSVFLSSTIVTAALMVQPHILTKTLYLKGDGDVRRFLSTALVAGLIFTGVLFVGFWARLDGLEVVAQDKVVSQYVNMTFQSAMMGSFMRALIAVALLAAGMSTLDGILVALSSMIVNDLYLPLVGSSQADRGLKLSRYVLVGVGLVAFALAWNPPKLVGLFAQTGVYGLVVATAVPIGVGVFYRHKVPAWLMGLSAVIGLCTHFGLMHWGGVANPSVSATYALGLCVLVTSLILMGLRARS